MLNISSYEEKHIRTLCKTMSSNTRGSSKSTSSNEKPCKATSFDNELTVLFKDNG